MPPSLPSKRKAIILAAGRNTRLYPTTLATAKSLLPVYDKPMIYYALALPMQAGIRDILLITTPEARESHRRLLGDGGQFGITLAYEVQKTPRGIADAFLIGRDYLDGAPSCLVLCDNLFHGADLPLQLQSAAARQTGATVFAHKVPDPQRFGVLELAPDGAVLSLEEKPTHPKSAYAATGCYFYDQNACTHAAALHPSARGELEITDLNHCYLKNGTLHAQRLSDNTTWFDMGTPDSMLEAANYIRTEQNRQNELIAAPEEIARRQGWIN